MFQSRSIKEPINNKGNNEKLSKCYSSSCAENFESFIEYFIAYEDDKDHRENNISICEKLKIDEIKSKNSVK